MRISDWSSDVCSSDLRHPFFWDNPNLPLLLKGQFGEIIQHIVYEMAGFRSTYNNVPPAVDPSRNDAIFFEQQGTHLTIIGVADDQIGRASWRERVCRYV